MCFLLHTVLHSTEQYQKVSSISLTSSSTIPPCALFSCHLYTVSILSITPVYLYLVIQNYNETWLRVAATVRGLVYCKPVSSICSTVPWTSWCCCIRELQTVWGTLYLPMTTSFPACQSPLFLTDLLMDYTMCISLKCMFNSCRRTKGSEKSPVIRN